ncbi:hypothetical protein U1Q18_034223 [Sarracenia purpurea var. burkii]
MIDEFRGLDMAGATEEGAGKNPDGEMPTLGPGATVSSGFGGLGLEGMVGNDESDGAALPGVGRSGVMSGGKAGGREERRGFGRNDGAAEIVEVGKVSEIEQPYSVGNVINVLGFDEGMNIKGHERGMIEGRKLVSSF